MASRDIIVVGSSAGGVRTLQRLIGALPGDLPASLFITQHLSPATPSLLASILDCAGALSVGFAEDGTAIEPTHVYIAPPDNHLVIDGPRMRVVHGPKENRHRPAIDPMLRSAAWSYGPRVIGVVLTGTLDDGAAGLWAVKACGGIAIVQDPADALYPDMPRNALAAVDVDYCLTLDDIAALLVRLVVEPLDDSVAAASVPRKIGIESGFALRQRDLSDMNAIGSPAQYSCPSCGGPLWEIRDGETARFRCHVGHAFQAPSLVAEQGRAIEGALESALRALEEKSAVLRRLATQTREHNVNGYEGRARAADASAAELRALLARLRE